MINNTKEIGASNVLLKGLDNIFDGFVQVNSTKPVAVFKATPKLNTLTMEDGDILGSYANFQKLLTNLQSGEEVQLLIKTKPYDLNQRLDTYNKLVDKARNAGNLDGDNYIRNRYPEYLKNWLENWNKLARVQDYEFYILYSYVPVNLDLKETPERLFIKNKDFLNSNKHVFINNISRVCDITQLEAKEIKDIIEDCVNVTAYENISMEYSKADTISRSGIKVEKDHIIVGDKYCKTIYISDFPEQRRNGFLQGLFLSGREFRISLFYEGISQESVRKKLEQQLKLANATVGSGHTANYASKELYQRYDALLSQYAAGQLSFINASLYVTLIEDSLEELNNSYGNIRSLLTDLPVFKGTIEQLPLFRSTLPLNINLSQHKYTTPTDDASTAYPFYNFDIGTTEGGVSIGTNILGQPVWYYPWSEDFTNGNCCVLGIPGSGKSFFNNSLLINLGVWDLDTFIIDKSKSYEFLTQINKGQYIKIDLEGKYTLNIFDCADYDKELTEDNDINASGEVSANKIASIVGFFKTLLLTDSASEWQLDKSLIESIIVETYKKMTIKDGIVDSKTIPTLSDFHNCIDKIIKEKTEWRQQLLMIKEKLNPYVGKGQYANLTDRQSSVDLKSSFIVFDTAGLPEDEDLQSLAVYIISNFLTKKFKQNKKKHRRQILVIDETWALARFEAGVKFLLNLAKRSRHMGLMCVFASQQINDFLGNPDAAQVLKSAEVTIFFKQSKTDLDNLGNLFALNEQQKLILGGLMQKKGEYSEAFAILGKLGSNKIYVRPNNALYWISTSDPKRDVPRRDEVLKSVNMNYEKALEILTRE